MLPDVIRVRNHKLQNDVPITKVTNVQKVYSVKSEISLGKEMFSEVLRLIKISFIPFLSPHQLLRGSFHHLDD